MRGLAMYNSLLKYCQNFNLYIFAFDDRSYELLNSLNLKNVTVISLREFEDERLLSVRSDRTKTEYCWTCTSSTILYCLEKFDLDICTYLDADIMFFDDPEILLSELKDKSILLTEHRHPLEHDKSAYSGKYCVQFITFKHDERGLKALRWWRDACLDWCYARPEDGKFGDQKYLDDWLTRFSGVHVLENLGGGVAPWNVLSYDFFYKNNEIYGEEIKNHKQFKIVFFHFHHAKIYNLFGKIKAKYFMFVNKPSEKIFYREYEKKLQVAYKKIKNIPPKFNFGFSKNIDYFIENLRENIPSVIKKFYRKISYDKKT
jgi:hypothetical protein